MTRTKGLYITVASHFKNFKASPSKVERAIRHAIESADSVIGDANGRLPNSEFLARAVDYLTLE
jgi:hypothetical protein